MVIIPLLNRKGVNFLSGSFYSLAIGPVWITDPLIGLQTLLTTMKADGALLLSLLIPVALALIFGRVFCGWVCPQNTLSELMDRIAERMAIKRLLRPKARALPRYIILIMVLAATWVFGFPLASLLSAPGIISVQTARLIYEGTVGLELGLIAVILLAELFLVRRIWCNYLCPVGGMLSLFRLKRTLKVSFTEDNGHSCMQCGECGSACRLGLNPMSGETFPLCHNCGDCIEACDKMTGERKPLSFRF